MAHLGERITEYIFEELPAAELAEAKSHVAQCGECKAAVEHFQRTRSLLQAVPDVDPPRSAVLTFEKPRVVRSWTWTWLAPMATAAVLLIAVFFQVRSSAIIEQQNAAIQQLQGQLNYIQAVHEKDLYEQREDIQLLAQRSSKVGD
jgi:anti-sigma factor RsiW